MSFSNLVQKVSTYGGVNMSIGWNNEEAYLIINDEYKGVIFGNTFRTDSIFDPNTFLVGNEYNNYNNDPRKYNMFIIGAEWTYGAITRKTYYDEVYDIVISSTHHINSGYLGIITISVLINRNTGGIKINQAKFAILYESGGISCSEFNELGGVSIVGVLT